MKIAFLDFDGVLNSAPFLRKVQRPRLTAGLPIFFTEDDGYMICPEAVGRLNRIIEATGAQVVISSGWRIMHSLDELVGFLTKAGFVGTVIGATPNFGGKPRGREIQHWLSESPVSVASFVILDDCRDMEHLSDRLVHTSLKTGLEDHHVERAIAMLSTPINSAEIPTEGTVRE